MIVRIRDCVCSDSNTVKRIWKLSYFMQQLKEETFFEE